MSRRIEDGWETLRQKLLKMDRPWVRLTVCEPGALLERTGVDAILPVPAALLEGLEERLTAIEGRLLDVERWLTEMDLETGP